MASATRSVQIRRPIEDVFAVLTDVENTGLWFPGNVVEHWTSPPPHGVGSTRHAVVRMFGTTRENDAVVTVYEPPRRAEMRGTSADAPFIATMTFTPDGEGTRVEVTTRLEGGRAMRLLGPIFLAWYGRAWGHGLATLKEMMEAGRL